MNAASATAPSRLTDADALEMYAELSIHELGRRAAAMSRRLHPQPYRTYVVDRNINYANVCTAGCKFCNFSRRPGSDEAYILTYKQIGRKIEELLAIGGTQVLMQGGLVPAEDHPSGQGLPFSWYLDLLKFIKTNYPTIHVHAFSPPEVWAFHQRFGIPLRDVLLRLREAGLDTIPGGGGEILVDRVRRRIGPGKALTEQWLAVMREAHLIGMKTSCTMMFGHIETVAERIEHLRRLRELQDETGGFLAFIHWPFQPAGTRLGKTHEERDGPRDQNRDRKGAATDRDARDQSRDRKGAATDVLPYAPGKRNAASRGPVDERSIRRDELVLADAHEYLKMLAIARLYLDNIPNVQASWVTMGPKIGQLALLFGANDMGSVMMEENVVAAAGTTYRLNEDQIRRLITDAGWEPQRRNQYYRALLAGGPTSGRSAGWS